LVGDSPVVRHGFSPPASALADPERASRFSIQAHNCTEFNYPYCTRSMGGNTLWRGRAREGRHPSPWLSSHGGLRRPSASNSQESILVSASALLGVTVVSLGMVLTP